METACDRCHKKLTVDESLVGREVRCPGCEYTFEVEPIRADNPAPENDVRQVDSRGIEEVKIGDEVAIDQEISRWFLRTPEGGEFGPVDRPILDTWVQEGRVASDCQLRSEAETTWHSSVRVYPVLQEAGNPFASQASLLPRQEIKPHRGKLILGLSIVGCVVPFLSLWPVVIGARDLRLMNLGKMDSAGDVMTRAGQAIAMVSLMIWIVAFAFMLLATLISMMSGL
jgi:hypothetical protein